MRTVWSTRALYGVGGVGLRRGAVRLCALARGGLLPLWPAAVYATLELAALAGLLIWFARARRLPRPELALVLGALPLLLAWHSAAGYFVALPALAVYAALPLLRRDIDIAQST